MMRQIEITYKDYYVSLKTVEEIEQAVKEDIETAMLIGSQSRIEVIKKVAEEVIQTKQSSENQITDFDQKMS